MRKLSGCTHPLKAKGELNLNNIRQLAEGNDNDDYASSILTDSLDEYKTFEVTRDDTD